VATLELSEKQLTYVILALDAYAEQLKNDEEDPGMSMMDSLFVSDLASRLRAEKKRAAAGE
jgi:hypothetical protein